MDEKQIQDLIQRIKKLSGEGFFGELVLAFHAGELGIIRVNQTIKVKNFNERRNSRYDSDSR